MFFFFIFFFFFFFQAEDGIRDTSVTGVQTCALPIWLLSAKLVKRFDDFGIDGLRTDTEGNLFVARILKGTIAVLTPGGKLKREIRLSAKEPTNLAFGGDDGKTVFVSQRQGGFVESFR